MLEFGNVSSGLMFSFQKSEHLSHISNTTPTPSKKNLKIANLEAKRLKL